MEYHMSCVKFEGKFLRGAVLVALQIVTWCLTYGVTGGNKYSALVRPCIFIQKGTGHASVGIFQVKSVVRRVGK
jgi:hypothetical protein